MIRTLRNPIANPFLLMFLVVSAGCSGNSDGANQQLSSDSGQNETKIMPQKETDTGWPTEPQKLVDHLNDWHADELIAYNEPERFPNSKTSGETNGWISAHEEQLEKLGVEISWDKQTQKYVITNPTK